MATWHTRIANVRRDAMHKLTSMLVREHGRIVKEDLNGRWMMHNRRLAPAIADVGFFEFSR
ncbi:hypothetical protein [Falsirhodobacter deserti]|uniref:hypothetical protein n=1 Tax=Falsirhodobacter deserti TaxID=1365611 RepID=UPI0013E377F8|nr:hypothetical protein [Falsirhodobacter deserti]